MPTVRSSIRLMSLAIAAPALLMAIDADAQQPYPVRPIRIVASQSAGGGIDTVCRLAAARLTESLGQNVIVENRTGANGTLAAEYTAHAPPDGYTLMLGAVGNLGVNGFLSKISYDPLRDLAPVTGAVSNANVLVVHPSVPAKSVQELIALARARPGQLAYASSGSGGTGHLAAALLQRMAKIDMLHVPYKGGAPAIVDLIGGQTQLSIASMPTAIPGMTSGKLRGLAVTTIRRSRALPQLPTMAESGLPGYEATAWYGFVAPARTPPEIIARLNQELVRILNRPDNADALLKQGQEVWTTTPEQFGAHMKTESDKWGRLIRELKITAG